MWITVFLRYGSHLYFFQSPLTCWWSAKGQKPMLLSLRSFAFHMSYVSKPKGMLRLNVTKLFDLWTSTSGVCQCIWITFVIIHIIIIILTLWQWCDNRIYGIHCHHYFLDWHFVRQFLIIWLIVIRHWRTLGLHIVLTKKIQGNLGNVRRNKTQGLNVFRHVVGIGSPSM